jgi:branched-chain amino acid aminotransferase
MINLNGNIIPNNDTKLDYNNRAFTYGDAVFETLKFQNGKIQFCEDHYFRLMASMRMLRMDIPNHFTLDFFNKELLNIAKANHLNLNARIRLQVFRTTGGYYTPKSSKIEYLIEATKLIIEHKSGYEIDLFKDYYIHSGILSTLKTTNRITNVIASIYADENGLNNCIFLNERKHLVEAINGNLFLVFGNTIKTPSLSEGCIKGIIRKKLIEFLKTNTEFTIEETTISPFDLLKADAVFITNSIIGIQAITKYRKTNYDVSIVNNINEQFKNYIS